MNANGRRSVDELDPPDEQRSRHLDKILHSHTLGGSETARNLLAYLAKRAAEEPGQAIKEFEIAVQVLGRDQDFDPRVDSSVRVQTARLRSKLAEYYLSEGADDSVLIEIPKGAYSLHYRPRFPHPPSAPAQQPALAAKEPGYFRGRGFWIAVLLTGAVVMASAMYIRNRQQPEEPPAPLRTFWKPFLPPHQEPLVVYSNAELIGSAFTGFRYVKPGDKREGIIDVYTGVGEVMAVHSLTTNFLLFRQPVRVVRGRLLTWDQAKGRNLIFLGSPEENLSARELPKLQEFNFKQRDAEPRAGTGAVINEHPRPGEERYYFNSGATPFTADHAVIAYVPGLKQQDRTLILAGITTHGTQAAAEFVCQPESVAELLSKLGVPEGQPLPFFEALISLQVSGGVPVRPKLTLVRIRETLPKSR